MLNVLILACRICKHFSVTTFEGSKWTGEDGVQGGHLQQHDHRVREARHQGLHLDNAQEQGGVGLKLEIDQWL